MPRIAMFPTRIFDLYKQLRKKVGGWREKSRSVSFGLTRSICRFLTSKFRPTSKWTAEFYERDVQRAWINEWLLMLLAKEVLLHSGVIAKKGASLRQWKTLAGTIDSVNRLENEIYGEYGSPDNVLVELIRIAHRTFEWQGNGPRADAIIRYHKILQYARDQSNLRAATWRDDLRTNGMLHFDVRSFFGIALIAFAVNERDR